MDEACVFWKNFVDVSQPNPAEGRPEAELEKLVTHLMECEECGLDGLELIDRLEKKFEEAEPDFPTEDATIERGFHLSILVMAHFDGTT
jgi:hypothetical protein